MAFKDDELENEEVENATSPKPAFDADDFKNTKIKKSVKPSDNKSEESKPKKITGASYKEEIENTRNIINSYPKKSIFIPLGPGERKGPAKESVTLNGCRFEYAKGVLHEVPEPIFDILAESLNINPGQDFRIDRSKDIQEALN